jgi:hypothetical protein
MWEQYKKESPFLSMLGMGGGGTGNALGGGGGLWYTKYPSDVIPSWDLNTNTTTFGPGGGSNYGYATDTFGHYILATPRGGSTTKVYNKIGQLVYVINDSTINNINSFGGCIDSTRGIIYICQYNSTNIYEIDISSDVTTTTDGTPMTFNSSSNSSPSYSVTTWNSHGTTSANDSICHYYDPSGTSTFWHDKLFTTGRNSLQVYIWNAGNKSNQGFWNLTDLCEGANLITGLYYFHPDWATNGWILGRRSGPLFYVYNTNRTIDTEPNHIANLGSSYVTTGGPEDYAILSDGSLVFGESSNNLIIKVWNNRNTSTPSLPSSTVFYAKGDDFTDSGPNAYTITKVGASLTAGHSTSKVGGGSFDFNGGDTEQYFYAGTNTFFDDSLSSWQFQCWARYTGVSGGAGNASGDMGLLIDQYASSVSGRMLFGFQADRIVLRVDGGTVYLDNGANLTRDRWYHIMLNWDGTTHRLFVNGTLASSSTTVPALYTGKRTEFGGGGDLSDYNLHGYMEHVLVEQGGTVKTADFVPTSPFVV